MLLNTCLPGVSFPQHVDYVGRKDIGSLVIRNFQKLYSAESGLLTICSLELESIQRLACSFCNALLLYKISHDYESL